MAEKGILQEIAEKTEERIQVSEAGAFSGQDEEGGIGKSRSRY